ncbi:MAG: DUF2723 domain-containing protein [Sandaracinaceae bacterium]|nr:DUF2723 domain-containing protein [Sandaracinaceae bacterium]
MGKEGVERLRAWCVERRVELALLVGFGVLYRLSAFPGPGGRIDYGASAELQLLPLYGGVPHGTGHPTYLLLCDAFEALWPAARAADRVTALSVVSGAVAVALFGALARRLTGNRLAATMAAILFGVSTASWSVATEASVHSVHLVFVLGTLLALVAWRDHRRSRDLLLACLLHALSYGNEVTTVLLLPTVAFMSLDTSWRAVLKPKNLALILWCVAIGAAQYGVVWSRSQDGGPYVDAIGPHASLGDVLARATAWPFDDAAFVGSTRDGGGARLWQAATELSVIGLVLAAIGAVTWRRLDRSLAIGLGLFAVASLIFGLLFPVPRGLHLQGLWLVGALAAGSALARIERPAWIVAVGLAAIGLTGWHAIDRGRVLDASNPLDDEQAAWIREAEGCEALLAGPEDRAHTRLRAYLSVAHDHGPMTLPWDEGRALELPRFCFTPEHLAVVEGSEVHRVEPERSTSPDEPVRLYRAVPRPGGALDPAPTEDVGLTVLEAWGTEGEPGWVVDGVVSEGSAWDAEGCLRFVGEHPGLVLGVTGAPVALEVAADNNDVYEVWCVRGDHTLHVADVPAVEGWGIVTRRVEVPDLASCERIGFAPGEGDGASSIAEVTAIAPPRLTVVEAPGTAGEPAVVVDGVAPATGTPWDCDGCLRFVEEDAAVVLEVHARGTALVVTADNNDVYSVSCDRGAGFEPIAEVPAVGGWGLAPRRVEIPTLAGCSRLRLAPREGDGSASIAEVELVGP